MFPILFFHPSAFLPLSFLSQFASIPHSLFISFFISAFPPGSLLALWFCQFGVRSQNSTRVAHMLLFASGVARLINTSISAAKFCFILPSMCTAITDWLHLEHKSPLRQMRANPTNCFIYLVAPEVAQPRLKCQFCWRERVAAQCCRFCRLALMLSSGGEKHSNYNSSANERPSDVVENNLETYWWNIIIGKIHKILRCDINVILVLFALAKWLQNVLYCIYIFGLYLGFCWLKLFVLFQFELLLVVIRCQQVFLWNNSQTGLIWLQLPFLAEESVLPG